MDASLILLFLSFKTKRGPALKCKTSDYYGDDVESFAFLEPSLHSSPSMAPHSGPATLTDGDLLSPFPPAWSDFPSSLYTNRESVGAAKVTEAIGTYKSRCFRRLTGSSPFFLFAFKTKRGPAL